MQADKENALPATGVGGKRCAKAPVRSRLAALMGKPLQVIDANAGLQPAPHTTPKPKVCATFHGADVPVVVVLSSWRL